jgi:hypothetical protein
MIAVLAYLLCLATALGAAVLLTRSYRSTGTRLLFWSAACFWGLSLSNALTIVDLYVMPAQDFYWARILSGLVSLALLVFGLVWDSR